MPVLLCVCVFAVVSKREGGGGGGRQPCVHILFAFSFHSFSSWRGRGWCVRGEGGGGVGGLRNISHT